MWVCAGCTGSIQPTSHLQDPTYVTDVSEQVNRGPLRFYARKAAVDHITSIAVQRALQLLSQGESIAFVGPETLSRAHIVAALDQEIQLWQLHPIFIKQFARQNGLDKDQYLQRLRGIMAARSYIARQNSAKGNRSVFMIRNLDEFAYTTAQMPASGYRGSVEYAQATDVLLDMSQSHPLLLTMDMTQYQHFAKTPLAQHIKVVWTSPFTTQQVPTYLQETTKGIEQEWGVAISKSTPNVLSTVGMSCFFVSGAVQLGIEALMQLPKAQQNLSGALNDKDWALRWFTAKDPRFSREALSTSFLVQHPEAILQQLQENPDTSLPRCPLPMLPNQYQQLDQLAADLANKAASLAWEMAGLDASRARDAQFVKDLNARIQNLHENLKSFVAIVSSVQSTLFGMAVFNVSDAVKMVQKQHRAYSFAIKDFDVTLRDMQGQLNMLANGPGGPLLQAYVLLSQNVGWALNGASMTHPFIEGASTVQALAEELQHQIRALWRWSTSSTSQDNALLAVQQLGRVFTSIARLSPHQQSNDSLQRRLQILHSVIQNLDTWQLSLVAMKQFAELAGDYAQWTVGNEPIKAKTSHHRLQGLLGMTQNISVLQQSEKLFDFLSYYRRLYRAVDNGFDFTGLDLAGLADMDKLWFQAQSTNVVSTDTLQTIGPILSQWPPHRLNTSVIRSAYVLLEQVISGQLSGDAGGKTFLSLFSISTTLVDKLDHTPSQENPALRASLMNALSVLMNPDAPIHQDSRFIDAIDLFAQLVNGWDNTNVALVTSLSQLLANLLQDQGESLFSSNEGEKRYAIVMAKEWKLFAKFLPHLKEREVWRLKSYENLAQFHAHVVNKKNLTGKTHRSNQNINRFIDSAEEDVNKTDSGFRIGGVDIEVEETNVNFIDAIQFVVEASTKLLEAIEISSSGYAKDGETRTLLTQTLPRELDMMSAALPFDNSTVFTTLMQGARRLLVVLAGGLLNDLIEPNN